MVNFKTILNGAIHLLLITAKVDDYLPKGGGGATVSSSRGLERGCDSVHHINTYATLYFFCVFCDFQTQNQTLSESKTHNKIP